MNSVIEDRAPVLITRQRGGKPLSVEALARLTGLPGGTSVSLRVYLHGDYLILYVLTDTDTTVYLLSIRHHRQLSFDFARFWPSAN
ncbi:hypothetical protein FACS189475_04060 [Betaproteobacteria bacterium]|nr:hypothetical protein FACS189475_04060 [Betaproteobacteria bacterium]